ncbi:hypothetical protein O4J56_00180 [Nocardiopsis sp. RSe5-2]|uniref:Uncharacterized protein n=1 Tax=Nocardiopsis endophytica TaxID=3018445 RepID=A0ABT4TX93_9ACTN|nr:hypothetical protein [Nocardiopsis endophytica]MDA2809046.1 hypothetical protein [Nocardiopsis endophytica]
MNTTLIGLIASLLGVTLGAALQFAHAKITRAWQIEDQARELDFQKKERTDSERRVKYSTFLKNLQTFQTKSNWMNILGGPRSPQDQNSPTLTEFNATSKECVAAVEQLIYSFHEVQMVTESKKTQLTARAIIAEITKFNPSKLMDGSPQNTQENISFQNHLAILGNAFLSASREELGVDYQDIPE